MHDAAYEVLYPAGGATARCAPAGRGALSTALYPLSVIYGGASDRVRESRIARRRPLEISAVVVSVGNLEVGGNGKTPLAIRLVNELARRGHRPACVSRGFMGAPERADGTTVRVPRSAEPKRWPQAPVRLLRGDAGGLAAALGDEGAMVAWRCPGVPLAFARDRRRAIETVFEMFEPTHVVLDDAFQTWSVPRDVDIVLLDAERPLGNGRMLPAGSLRERPEALGRAHVVGFNALERGDDLAALGKWVRGRVGREIPVFGIRRDLALIDGDSGEPAALPAGAVAAVSGIGRPARFEKALLEKGLDVRLSLRYPDHFVYGRSDVRRMGDILGRRGLGTLVTTEKDWVKLREFLPLPAELRLARVEIEITGDDPIPACEKPQASPAVSL